MRLATYNIEWFSRLFDQSDNLIDDGSWSGKWNVTKSMQINAIASVIKAINADAIMIIEAPDTSINQSAITALENFAAKFLSLIHI